MRYPIKLKPAFKDYLWGGTKLAESYGKKSPDDIIAESWELSTHKDGKSIVADGDYAGQTLSDYIEKQGGNILGQRAAEMGSVLPNELPVLIKFIDSNQDLSIQVHPDDSYARKNENDNGKTEMWLILESEPGAFLYLGVSRDVTREEMEKAVILGDIDSVLKRVPVKKGDVIFVPAGTIHAIGKGIVICEIQQCSNVTYRLYDFNRVGADGKKRPLHLQKALDVAMLKPQPVNVEPQVSLYKNKETHVELLRSCSYFNTYRYRLGGSAATFGTKSISFAAVVCLEGSGTLKCGNETLSLEKGETVFVPAYCEDVELAGFCELLVVML